MATYTWSVPTGQVISGNTYIKDTDDKLQNTLDDLVDFVNSEGVHFNQGLTYDLVNKASAQTITGIKTFSNGIVSNVTGNVTGDLTGNAATASEATALGIGADRTKLDGIEAGATADQTGAEIKIAYEANTNTNAYTDTEKNKLAGIAAGAQVNVQPDWDATTGDAQILNKPSNLITDAGKSLSKIGYQQLGNGLILQWGYVDMGTVSGGSYAVGSQKQAYTSFAITFPTACLNVTVTAMPSDTENGGDNGGRGSATLISYSNTGARVAVDPHMDNYSDQFICYYSAIGY